MVNEISRRSSVAVASLEPPGISVSLDVREGQYQARIVTSAPTAGERVISDPGPSCVGLSRAVAVTLALLLDPAGTDTPPRAEAAPNETGRDSPGSPATRPVSAPRLDAEIGAAAALGLTFNVAPAAAFGTTVSLRNWSAHLGMLWIPESERIAAGVPLQLELRSGRSRVCRVLWSERGAWPRGAACLHAVAGEIRATARDVDAPTPARAAWLGIGGGPTLVGSIVGRVTWRWDAAALAPVVDERFAVRGVGQVHHPPPVAAWVGFAVSLPIL